MGKRDLTRLVNSGIDPDELEDLTEETPRLKDREGPRDRMDTGRKRGTPRSPRPWVERTER